MIEERKMELGQLEEFVREKLSGTGMKETNAELLQEKLIEAVKSREQDIDKMSGEAKAGDITDDIKKFVVDILEAAGFNDLSNQDATMDYENTALSELIPKLEECLEQIIEAQKQASSEDQRNTGEGGTKMGGP